MFSITESINSSNKKKKRLLKILLLSATSGMLTLVSICGCLMKMKITRKGLKVKKENLELPLFDLTIIAAATNNFSR